MDYSSGLGQIVQFNTLISHFPLPSMPFDTHKNIVFESGKSDTIQETRKAVDKKADSYRYDDVYAYHPHNMNKMYPKQGRNVDFVVA